MPYIIPERREALWHSIEANSMDWPESPGELNFLFTALAVEYLERQGTSYPIINDVLGALEGAKQEFYRRVAVPYEDLKWHENGDVY